jgi:AcrR family transcriptional regulator
MTQGTLRSQQRELTHRRIYEAAMELILAEGVQAFTIRGVATRAGISYRTVYRHFPTPQALLDALGDYGREEHERAGRAVPQSLEEAATHARRLFEAWDTEADMVRALATLRIETGMSPRERHERLAMADRLLQEFAPHSSEQDRARVKYSIQALGGTVTWMQMKDDWSISGLEAGDAVAHAITLLVEDLRKKEQRAAKAAAVPKKPSGRGKAK